MEILTYDQRRRLKALAHHLKPMIQVGHKGITDTLIGAVNEAIESHELIKIKFVNHKEDKRELSESIALGTSSILVVIIGNIAIFYRQNMNTEKRKIKL